VAVKVTPAPVTIVLSDASPNNFVHPTTVTFTVTFTSGSVDGGTVTLTDGGKKITGVVAYTMVNGATVATFTISYSAAGTHTIVATYSGDTNYATATSNSLTVVIS
jgi:Bacterial Ig-like domain (group 3)